MTKQEIGQILREAREAKGLSRKQVAEMMNRNEKIVGHWETGYSQPDANTLFELCDLYDLSIDEAFGKKKTVKKGENDDVSPNDLLGTPSQKELSEEAISFARSFDALDASGKAVMQAVLETQQQRIRECGPAVKLQSVEIVRKRIPMIQGTHEAEIQMRYQSRQEQHELQQSETLEPTET